VRGLIKPSAAPGLKLVDVPEPEPGPNDVVIDISYTSICGTDLHIDDWDEWASATVPVGMVVGHEFSGVVAAIGSAVTDVEVGRRVTGEGHLTCGHCRNCRAGRRHLCPHTLGIGVDRPGAFADRIVIPSANVFPLPDHVPLEMGSIFDPFGNATHTALEFDLAAEDVLITGAGPIGCMAAAIASHVGARHVVVTDVNDYRLGLAARLGATHTINVERSDLSEVMKELDIREGFDIALEMSGAPEALRSILPEMIHGGRVALLGLLPDGVAIDWSTVIFHSLTLKGVYGREMYDTWYKMGVFIEGGLDLSPIITHTFDAEDFEQAFEAVRSGHTGKVLLDWT
jgi:threonine 3-dehydrogenase